MVVVGLVGSAVTAAPETKSPAEKSSGSQFVGITEPSVSAKLGFDIRGVVGEVNVKRNDHVKVGQPLLSLVDTEEKALLDRYKLEADTALEVAEAQETAKVKTIDYQRKLQMFNKGQVATDFEVKTAQAEMNIANIKVEQAKHQGAVAQAQANAQQARVDKMHKLSPIDGEIRDVTVKPGEQVDESKPVLEVVDLDPLYVEVKLVESSVVQKLKLGDKVQVKYSDEDRWREAEVESIDPSADARTTTHPFRLRLPNPEGRNAGLRVDIQLPGNVASAQ